MPFIPPQETPGLYEWEVFFEGLPEWSIPLMKVVPELHTSNEWVDQWNNLSFSYDFSYYWEQVDGTNYKLHLYLISALSFNVDPLPLFVNLSVWFINTNYRDSIQHNRGY